MRGPTPQQIHSAGWWKGYAAGRLDEQEGVPKDGRIAPKIPKEMEPGYRLGELIGKGFVVMVAVALAVAGVAVIIGAALLAARMIGGIA